MIHRKIIRNQTLEFIRNQTTNSLVVKRSRIPHIKLSVIVQLTKKNYIHPKLIINTIM